MKGTALHGPEFYLADGQPVGFFKTEVAPQGDGRYRYEPFRGPGHFLMGSRLRDGIPVSCYYLNGDRRITFTVDAVPEYGYLQLSRFR